MVWLAPVSLGAFALGIALSKLPLVLALAGWLLAAGLVAWLRSPRERPLRLFLVMLVAAGLAASLESTPAAQPADAVERYDGQALEAYGTVRTFPRETTATGSVIVDLAALRLPNEQWNPVALGLKLGCRPGRCPEKGEKIFFAAQPSRFHNLGIAGEYDEEGHMCREGIFLRARVEPEFLKVMEPAGRLDQILTDVRERILGALRRSLSTEEAGVVAGLIVGDQQWMTPPSRQAWRRAGVTHLVSISGLHLAIIFVLLKFIARRVFLLFPPLLLRLDVDLLSGALAMPGVVFYALISGSQAPTLRSLAMLMVLWSARSLGRRTRAYEPLAWGALVLMALDPQLLFSIGFQLSFTAVFGAVAWGRVNEDSGIPTWWEKAKTALWAAFIGSLIATVWTFPLSTFHFGQASIIGILANLPLIPYVSLLVTPLAFLFACLAAWVPQGPWPWFVLEAAVKLANVTVDFFAAVPGAGLGFRLDMFEAVAFALFLGGISLTVAAKAKRWRRRGLAAATMVLAGVGLHEWQLSRQWQADLRVDVLSIGQGDAVLITSRGRHMLVDTGGGMAAKGEGYDRVLKPYFISQRIFHLDALLLTHPHEDHVGAAADILRDMRPNKLVVPSIAHFEAVRPEILAAARLAGVAVEQWSAGESRAWQGVTWSVLHPSVEFRDAFAYQGVNWNDISLALRAETDSGASVCLTGDAEHEAEEAMLALAQKPCGLLKAGHHGSRTSTDERLLDLWTPEFVVISAGYKNQFRHPHAQTLRHFEGRNIPWRVTAKDGTVTALFDDNHMEIKGYYDSGEWAWKPLTAGFFQ